MTFSELPPNTQEWLDAKGFVRFLHQVISTFEPIVADAVNRLLATNPGMTFEAVADQVIYSPQDSRLSREMRSNWTTLRLESPFAVNGGLSPHLLELLFRQILQIDLLAEVFRKETAAFPRADLVLAFLYNETLKTPGAHAGIQAMVGFLSQIGQERAAEEVLRNFHQMFGRKTTKPRGRDFLTSGMFGTQHFLHLRQTAQKAKMLFNDGQFSPEEDKKIRDFSQEFLQRVLLGLISMAHADGQVTEEEKKFIPQFCKDHGLPVPDLELYEFAPEVVNQLNDCFPSPEQKRFFLGCLRDVMEADGQASEVEKKFLELLETP